jgi:uncharacterized protein (TIGR02444 family)
MEEIRGEAFWRFSLALYAGPGVAEALIALQDRAGRDVNLMLFALWLGATGGQPLDAAALNAAEASSAAVNAVVAPLRALRRQLKDAADRDVQALRSRIAALEIAGERRAQCRLAAGGRAEPRPGPEEDRLAAATANLALYLGKEDRSNEAELLRQALAGLMRRR